MNSTHEQNTNIPAGLYALSSLAFILIINVVLELVQVASYNVIVISSALIIVTIYGYVGIGIIKAWPNTRMITMVLAILYFLGTLVQIATIGAVEWETLGGIASIIRIILGIAIPPVIVFYLRKQKVMDYFSRHDRKHAAQ